MKRAAFATLALVAALALALVAGRAEAASSAARDTQLVGTGATFPFPLISKWIPEVGKAYGINITYSPTGSGAGIAAITARTVDFGASDAPLSDQQLSDCKGCVVIPWALAAVSIPYNLPGVNGRVHLNGTTLANIYLGSITSWNDPAIKKLNPKLDLPDTKITPVYRSDGSGTTYAYTNYLSAVSPQFSRRVGFNTSVNFPTGVGARGSSGVAGVVKNTPGAVCYVDTGYAITNHLRFAAVKNAAGRFINPSIRNVKAAGDSVKTVPAGNEMHIVNPPKSNPTAYPISTYTYIILPTKSSKAAELRKMVFWALTQGQSAKYTAKLWFVAIPKTVLAASEKTLKQVTPAT